MKIIEVILEVLGWLCITLGTTLGAGLISFAIYSYWESQIGKIIAIAVLIIGFIGGAIWATIVWKKHGTIAYLSSIRRIS